MLVVTILVVLTMSAIWAVPARADDGAPPPAETAEVVPPPEESTPEAPVVEPPAEEPIAAVEELPPAEETPLATAEPALPTEEVAPTELPAVEGVPTEAPIVEELPVEEPAPQEEAPTAVLAQVPDGTDVIVVDEAGTAVALATQEAADILVSGDPIWCPATVTVPTPGAGGCSGSFTSMEAMITYLTASPKNVAGIIWIEKTYDSSVNDPAATGFTLNGDLLGTTANFALTLQGGWNGLGTGTIDTNDRSEFNVPLNVVNWNANVTLSDLLLTGVPAGGPALNVDTSRDIVLRRVDVVDNMSSGATLDNTDLGTGTGNITINRSQFSRNSGGHGLDVSSRGAITFSSVYVNGNSGYGASVDNSTLVGRNVSLASGVLEFNDNGGNGLSVWSAGNITLMDITAAGNDLRGAYLDNEAGTGVITLSGINIFSENTTEGLVVFSHGAISASNVIANANGDNGASFYNDSAPAAAAVTLTGTSEFKFNGFNGLDVRSRGVITLNNITANNNVGNGAYLDNSYNTPSAPMNVILTGYGTFHNNNGDGLLVRSYGKISLTDINANNNANLGAYLNNAGEGTVAFPWATIPKAVTLSLTEGNPDTEFQGNTNGGVDIRSLGTITLNGVLAGGSSNGFGAYLQNDYTGGTGDIILGGWGGSFGENATYGFAVSSNGNITLSSLWAFNNNGVGAHLDTLGAITITGSAGFGNNSGPGLRVFSQGIVTLNNVFANGNNGTGVIIDNTYSGAGSPQDIFINGDSHDFSNNNGNGLEINSYGAITIQYLYANRNAGFGVMLTNSGADTPKPVTLNGNNTFEWNTLSGLLVLSKGKISVQNVIARDNGYYGASLSNQFAGTTSDVLVKNSPDYWPEFARNGLDGLRVSSNGNITIWDLDAHGNGWAHTAGFGYGVYLSNNTGLGNVTLGTSRANWHNGLNDNFLSGLEVFTTGAVTLSNLRNNNNGLNDGADNYYGYGAYIYNAAGSLGVTLLGSNEFHNNASGGLYVLSSGTILADHIYDALGAIIRESWLEADNNGNRSGGGDGVHLENWTGTLNPVTLVGNGNFFYNYNNGLYIVSLGVIRVNNITSNDNGDGAKLYNYYSGPGTLQGVILTGYNQFSNNYNNGLDIQSFGGIRVANVDASDNGQRSVGGGDNGFGVRLDNCLDYGAGCTATTPQSIIMKGNNNFRNNLDAGLSIFTMGAIKFNNVSADDNGSGITATNDWDGATAGVTVTGGLFTGGNDTYGMILTSRGAITITVEDAWAGNNGSWGWYISNENAPTTTPQPVTLSSPTIDWAFDFDSNGTYGLSIRSLGDITTTGLDATNNGGDGATLNNALPGATGIVTISAPEFGNNSFSSNVGTGLTVYSYRAISIGNLQVNNNGWDCSGDPCVPTLGAGAYLDNQYAEGLGFLQSITITGFAEFNNNGDTGLRAFSNGKITINNLSASDNGQFNKAGGSEPLSGRGAYLDNDPTGITPKTIVLTGSNTFNNNFLDGLVANSLGNITINDLTANNNGGDGAFLDNQQSGAIGNVTLTTSTTNTWSVFNGNGGAGLNVQSNGAIAARNVQANNNTDVGASLVTDGVSAPQTVTLTGKNVFQNNSGVGLYIETDGNITLSNLTANFNNGDGVYLDSCLDDGGGCTASGSITITGTNTFRSNSGIGLYFDAGNTMSLTRFTADGNGDDGIRGYGQSITLTCGSITRNSGFGYGYWLDAWGTPNLITLQGVFAYGNGINGWTSGTLVQTRTCPLP